MEKRTALITGASKGIGRATAERLAARGHHVIGLARTDPNSDFPGEFIAVDLSDRAATAEALADVTARGEIDIVINNVGLVYPAPLGEISHEELDAVLEVNLHCAVQCTQAALPAMKQNGWGRIVNTTSLVVAGVPFRTSYAAAKSALVSCTKSWALELAEFGITVNAVSPGPIRTELFLTNNPPGSESHTRYVGMVPMKRVGAPAEVAAAIVFLASNDAAFITGQNLYVDGGASVGRAQTG